MNSPIQQIEGVVQIVTFYNPENHYCVARVLTPGQGQIDHEQLFRTLFGAGFNGPMAIERLDGRDTTAKLTPEVVGERLAAAYRHLTSVLDRVTAPA